MSIPTHQQTKNPITNFCLISCLFSKFFLFFIFVFSERLRGFCYASQAEKRKKTLFFDICSKCPKWDGWVGPLGVSPIANYHGHGPGSRSCTTTVLLHCSNHIHPWLFSYALIIVVPFLLFCTRGPFFGFFWSLSVCVLFVLASWD